MTIETRLRALEARAHAGRLGTPCLIVQPGQSLEEAREEYERLHGHAPPDDVLRITITCAKALGD